MFNLPLKTKENPKGIYSEHELYMVLAIIFVCIVSNHSRTWTCILPIVGMTD